MNFEVPKKNLFFDQDDSSYNFPPQWCKSAGIIYSRKNKDVVFQQMDINDDTWVYLQQDSNQWKLVYYTHQLPAPRIYFQWADESSYVLQAYDSLGIYFNYAPSFFSDQLATEGYKQFTAPMNILTDENGKMTRFVRALGNSYTKLEAYDPTEQKAKNGKRIFEHTDEQGYKQYMEEPEFKLIKPQFIYGETVFELMAANNKLFGK